MSLKIERVYHMDDETVDELVDLQKLCFGNTAPLVDPEKYGTWWLAFDGKEVAGFAAVRPSMLWKNWGFLMRVGVLPNFRGQGLQRRFIGVRERFAREMDWDGLVTYTIANTPSANNLARAGYQMYDPKNHYIGSPQAIYWRKWL